MTKHHETKNMNKIVTTFLFLTFVVGNCFAQSNDFINPDSILIGNKKLPKVLLVATWHFNYSGLDAHQVEEKDRINIYSDRRQKELEELLDYLAEFKPTKILVESAKITGYLLKNYERYKNGERELYANERSQIGMRLVDRFKLDTIYGVDAWPLLLELNDNRDTLQPKGYTDKILERHYFGGDDEISKKYTKFYEYNTKMTVEKTLLENFKYLNSDKVITRYFGNYVAGGQFESENYEGPDALSMFWLNRNVRIFKNIKDIDYNENDRILILFGTAHIPILRFFFESSPEFELVNFNELGE